VSTYVLRGDLAAFLINVGMQIGLGRPVPRHADPAIDALIQRAIDGAFVDVEPILNSADEITDWLLSLPRVEGSHGP